LWERPDQTPATVTPEELRSIRRAARVSLRDLAEALGVEHSFISRIETGGRGFYRPFEEQALAAIERLRRHEPRRRKVYVGKPEDSEFLARVRAALAEGEPLPRVASTVGYKSVAGMAYRLRNLGIPFFPARGTRALSMLLAEDRQPAGVAP
jgi:transcriptional regulator with XRE-family HTH domain